MGRLLRVGAVLAACLALFSVATAAASVGTKKISDTKYAKTLCTRLSELKAAEQQFADQVQAAPKDDATAFQSVAVSQSDQYIAAIKDAEAKIKNLTPDVGGGKNIQKTFTKFMTDFGTELESATNKFRAADPNNVAFQADITQFAVAFQLLDTKIGDPFSKVTNQELLGAFKKEKSCKDVVSVF